MEDERKRRRERENVRERDMRGRHRTTMRNMKRKTESTGNSTEGGEVLTRDICGP